VISSIFTRLSNTCPSFSWLDTVSVKVHSHVLRVLEKSQNGMRQRTVSQVKPVAESAAVTAMRKHLQSVGEVPDEQQWKTMTDGFCSLFDRYLQTKSHLVDWYHLFALYTDTFKGVPLNNLRPTTYFCTETSRVLAVAL
jgi:hypothetical protein